MACNSYVINQRKGFESVTRRMDGLRYGELVLSSIVLAELQFMVAKSAVPQGKREQLLRFLLQFHVAPFDEPATVAYGLVRHQLELRQLDSVGRDGVLCRRRSTPPVMKVGGEAVRLLPEKGELRFAFFLNA